MFECHQHVDVRHTLGFSFQSERSVRPPPPFREQGSDEFLAGLKLLLRNYLEEGHPSVEWAALAAETSVRTLQRRLEQYGQTYSHLVQQVRFECAERLLQDPDTKIIDVALSVGYGDPSHFARAFRRLSGVSPREFRRLLA